MKKYLYFFTCVDCQTRHKMRELAFTSEDPEGWIHYFCSNCRDKFPEEGGYFEITRKIIEVKE